MRIDTLPADVETLADVRPGEMVILRGIVGDPAHHAHFLRGLSPGDVVCCHEASDSHLTLETAGGTSVMIERDRARRIRVERPVRSVCGMSPPRRRRELVAR